jgi:hypothetical protein
MDKLSIKLLSDNSTLDFFKADFKIRIISLIISIPTTSVAIEYISLDPISNRLSFKKSLSVSSNEVSISKINFA